MKALLIIIFFLSGIVYSQDSISSYHLFNKHYKYIDSYKTKKALQRKLRKVKQDTFYMQIEYPNTIQECLLIRRKNLVESII